MKLDDLTWETFEPLVDGGLYPTANCPSCRQYVVVNVWEQEGGWLVQCVECKQMVPSALVLLAAKPVIEALGHDSTVHDADAPGIRRPLN